MDLENIATVSTATIAGLCERGLVTLLQYTPKQNKRNVKAQRSRRSRGGRKASSRTINPFVSKNLRTVIKSTYNGNFNSSTNTVISRYFVAHPAYGINGGSASWTMYNNTVVSATGAGYGWFNRFIIRRWKMTFRLKNMEAYPVTVSVLPVPYLSVSAMSVASPGYQKQVAGFRGCKTVLLGPATLPNSIKTLALDVDTSKLEGISKQGMEQTGYWCTTAVIGSLYQMALLQVWNIGGDLSTTAGVDIFVTMEFHVDCIGNSVTTLY